ncbi:hypothetical protein BV898_04158 [Hypsibius exemplaris]|uniref:Uncharacterized protein n=1 Tax=Hypsibius exemplaris TaxID=2072580 RepID=A0A1W0X380_HYPEX|nr:hypothetical protein BV898_04158 [Hypsibius exemplaris]
MDTASQVIVAKTISELSSTINSLNSSASVSARVQLQNETFQLQSYINSEVLPVTGPSEWSTLASSHLDGYAVMVLELITLLIWLCVGLSSQILRIFGVGSRS